MDYLGDVFGQVLASLSRNRLRTFLTMAGIAWGIASIVLIVAMGDSFKAGQEASMKHLGDNIAIVFAGRTEMQAGGERAGRLIRLNYADVEALRGDSSFDRVTGELEGEVRATSAYNSGSFEVSGVEWFFPQMRDIPLAEGRFITPRDQADAARVIVIGEDVKKQLFGERSGIVGTEIAINSIPYRIIGLMAHKEQNDSYSGLDEKRIWLPYTAMARDVPPKKFFEPGFITEILYQPRAGLDPKRIQQDVRSLLGRRHGFDRDDPSAVRIWDTAENRQVLDGIIDSMTLFLSFIGVVTLSLGGIGVMNIMLVTVSERTREVGLRKALGATRLRILVDFLVEGCVLAFGSGLVGWLGVWALSALMAHVEMPEMFPGLPVSGKTTALAFGALTIVALLSSLTPAWRAASLTPVEALRDER